MLRVNDVRMVGLASAVPDFVRTVDDDALRFGEEDARKISESVGIKSRRIAPEGLCASDLCASAGERLLDQLGWERDSVQALLFVTQTPDYRIPATACTLQARLGLSTACAAMDINLGCSGYVYGLATAAQFARGLAGSQEGGGRVLLLVGDTLSRMVSPDDRSAALLFGDAGTATALEYSQGAPEMFFDLGTDGSGAEHLIVPAGGFRRPATPESHVRTERENGNIRSDEDLVMDGGEVFLFTLSHVPGLVKRTLKGAGWTPDDIDGVVLHQANAFMLNHLRKRLKLDDEKMILALDSYGNTSSASIPLAMTHTWAKSFPDKPLQLILGGFGVGWSWGGAAVTCDDMVMPELITVPAPQAADAREVA